MKLVMTNMSQVYCMMDWHDGDDATAANAVTGVNPEGADVKEDEGATAADATAGVNLEGATAADAVTGVNPDGADVKEDEGATAADATAGVNLEGANDRATSNQTEDCADWESDVKDDTQVTPGVKKS